MRSRVSIQDDKATVYLGLDEHCSTKLSSEQRLRCVKALAVEVKALAARSRSFRHGSSRPCPSFECKVLGQLLYHIPKLAKIVSTSRLYSEVVADVGQVAGLTPRG